MPQRCRALFFVLQELPLSEDSYGITDGKPSPAEACCERQSSRHFMRVDDDHLLLITTDRVSDFDVVMNEAVRYKGEAAGLAPA